MDAQSLSLLIVVVVIVVVLAVMTTGVHIVRPGEIGFLYRRNKFLRLSGPALVFGPPFIGKMYRLNAKTLRILLERPAVKMMNEGTALNLKTEVTLDIVDPSMVPIRNGDLGAEVKRLASDAFKETISRMRSREDHNDPSAFAKELGNNLNRAVEKMGFRVASVKVGDHRQVSGIGELENAEIPSWDDMSRRLKS